MKNKQIKCYCGHTDFCDCSPLEEPKFVTENIESTKGEDLGKVSYIPLPNIDYDINEKHLEEFIDKSNTPDGLDQFSYDKGLKDGANWQQKRMYSEEEVGELLYNVIGKYAASIGIIIDGAKLNDLFNEFKKIK